jgi:hypothetical protein
MTTIEDVAALQALTQARYGTKWDEYRVFLNQHGVSTGPTIIGDDELDDGDHLKSRTTIALYVSMDRAVKLFEALSAVDGLFVTCKEHGKQYQAITSMNNGHGLDFRSFGDTSDMDFNPGNLYPRVTWNVAQEDFGREFATIGVFDTVWEKEFAMKQSKPQSACLDRKIRSNRSHAADRRKQEQ